VTPPPPQRPDTLVAAVVIKGKARRKAPAGREQNLVVGITPCANVCFGAKWGLGRIAGVSATPRAGRIWLWGWLRCGRRLIRTVTAGVLIAGGIARRAWVAAIDTCFALVLDAVVAGGRITCYIVNIVISITRYITIRTPAIYRIDLIGPKDIISMNAIYIWITTTRCWTIIG
jgi:hypothetical protein